jgi:hypothetical protein
VALQRKSDYKRADVMRYEHLYCWAFEEKNCPILLCTECVRVLFQLFGLYSSM